MSKELKYVEEIVIDELFIKFVGEVIDEVSRDRRNRPEPRAGYRYKKDGIDTLQQQGEFNKEFFLFVIKPVWLRKSSLTSKTRGIVEAICGEALKRARAAYAAEVPGCKHENIKREDGLDECMDCGAKNY